MNLGKKVFVLAFLIVILVGVFMIQEEDFGEGYFSWLKTKITGMGPELNLTEQDSGLDLSEFDAENFSKIDSVPIETRELPTVAEIVEEDDGLENIDAIIGEDLVIEEEPAVVKDSGVAKEEIDGIGGPTPGTTEILTLAEIEQELERIIDEIEVLIVEIQKLTNNNL